MYKDNNIILKRFNGSEIYEYTEGEYINYIENYNYVHNIIIYAEKPIKVLDDSVCDSCGGVHLDISIKSTDRCFRDAKIGTKYNLVPTYANNEEIILWLVCCEHIEMEKCDIEVLNFDVKKNSITLQISAELWGPSNFDESKAMTKLYYRGEIPFKKA